MLHVLVLMLADVHLDATAGGPRFRSGERYNVPEETAARLVSVGDAEALEVQEQRLPDGSVPDKAARAACLDRIVALAPKKPEPEVSAPPSTATTSAPPGPSPSPTSSAGGDP